MKKIFLGIGLILISGIVSAKGLDEGMEKVLFPSWWGAEAQEDLKGLEKELEELKIAKGKVETEIHECIKTATSEENMGDLTREAFDEKVDEEIKTCNKKSEAALADAESKLEKKLTEIETKKGQVRGEKNVQPAGVIGYTGDQKFGLQYIPQMIDILLKFVAPIVMIMFIFAGSRLIYASGNDEDLEKSKTFFIYALLGVIFIVVSYSLMKALYFFLAT